MTWFSYDNYGTALQVTALSHELSKEDNEVFLVNYLPSGRVVKIPKKKTLKSFSDRIYRKIRRLLGGNSAESRALKRANMPCGESCVLWFGSILGV